MKIKYVERRFSPASITKIQKANEIIKEYAAQGYDLTLRQLYYQFVARALIANTQREYKNLGSVINDARLAGLISWRAIVDRTRNLQANPHWENAAEIVEACVSSFQMDLWSNQGTRLEVWIEKDALIGVIEGVCKELDVAYFSCRGYTSQSEMWGAAERLLRYEERGQETLILHLGDHDPSGIDMTRDIQDRLRIFGVNTHVERIALNMDQIEKFDPPPNPTKLTDARAANYIEEYGDESWELDAMEPRMLEKLIRKEIEERTDIARLEDTITEQDEHIDKLRQVAEDLENE